MDSLDPNRIDPNSYGLIHLDSYANDNFSLFGYTFTAVMDDILLVKYVDMSDDGQTVMRGGILMPINNVQKAWRIGRVILAGPNCKYVKANDFICFPHDKGIPVSNLDVTGIGKVKHAIFLNEQRIFGICARVDVNTSDAGKPTDAVKTATKQRRRGKV